MMQAALPRAPRWTRQISWRTLAVALLLGGIVHILATLAIPMVGAGNAFRRLADKLPINRMVVLPAPVPGTQPLPYLSADALYAACRYDISGAPVTINAVLPDPGWTLSLHSPQGDNFYVMPSQQSRSEITFMIVPAADHTFDFRTPPARQATGEETQVESPKSEGLILVRAPLRGLAWRAETEAKLRRAGCTPAPQRR